MYLWYVPVSSFEEKLHEVIWFSGVMANTELCWQWVEEAIK